MHTPYFTTVPAHLSAEQQAERAHRLPIIRARLAASYPAGQEPPAELIELLQRYLDHASLSAAQSRQVEQFLAGAAG